MQRRDHGESLFLLCKTSFSVTSPPSRPPVAPRKLVEMFEAEPFSIRTGSSFPPFPSPSFPREELEVGFRSGFSPGRAAVGAPLGFAGCSAFAPRRGASGVQGGGRLRGGRRAARARRHACGGCERGGVGWGGRRRRHTDTSVCSLSCGGAGHGQSCPFLLRRARVGFRQAPGGVGGVG